MFCSGGLGCGFGSDGCILCICFSRSRLYSVLSRIARPPLLYLSAERVKNLGGQSNKILSIGCTAIKFVYAHKIAVLTNNNFVQIDERYFTLLYKIDKRA